MGTWGPDFAGSDRAADWFADALKGAPIDQAIESALKYFDAFDECRAAVYLLTVLGASSYVWPGDLNKLDDFVKRAISRMEAMLDPEKKAHRELVGLWGREDAEIFAQIRRELDALKAAHAHRL